jgi:hypothetical protein
MVCNRSEEQMQRSFIRNGPPLNFSTENISTKMERYHDLSQHQANSRTHPKAGFAAGAKAETDDAATARHNVSFIMVIAAQERMYIVPTNCKKNKRLWGFRADKRHSPLFTCQRADTSKDRDGRKKGEEYVRKSQARQI